MEEVEAKANDDYEARLKVEELPEETINLELQLSIKD